MKLSMIVMARENFCQCDSRKFRVRFSVIYLVLKLSEDIR